MRRLKSVIGLIRVQVCLKRVSPLPSVTGNTGNGPVIDMSMFYTPVVNNVFALGDGWSFAFTVYNPRTQKLTLHSGEVIEISNGEYFDSQVLRVVQGGGTLHLTHRNGRTETLKRIYRDEQDANSFYLPATLTMDGYNFLNFEWSVERRNYTNSGGVSQVGYQYRLMSVSDACRELVNLTYAGDDEVKINFWPNDEKEKLTFTLALSDYKLDTVTAPEGGDAVTRLDYIDHSSCGWLLANITTFEGVREEVRYLNDFKFQSSQKLNDLPNVVTHEVTSRGGCCNYLLPI